MPPPLLSIMVAFDGATLALLLALAGRRHVGRDPAVLKWRDVDAE